MEIVGYLLVGLLAALVGLTAVIGMHLRRGIPQQADRIIDAIDRAAGVDEQPTVEPTPIVEPYDPILIGPPQEHTGDDLKDWVQHYSMGRYSWSDVGAEVYRQALASPLVAPYFDGMPVEDIQRKFIATMVVLTSQPVRQSMVDRMARKHRNVMTPSGEPITEDVFNAVINVVVTVLTRAGVSDKGITELGEIVEVFRPAILKPETVLGR